MKTILSVVFLLTVGISSIAQQMHYSKFQVDSMQELSTRHKNAGIGMVVGGSVLIVGGLVSWLKAIDIAASEDWDGFMGYHYESKENKGMYIAFGVVGYGVGIPLLITGIRKINKAYKINKALQKADISMSTQYVPSAAGGVYVYSVPQTSLTLKIALGK